MIDYNGLYQSSLNLLPACAHTWTTAKYFNCMTWHTAKEHRFFWGGQMSGSYGAGSLSEECCRCAFVRRSYSIWANTQWLSACCTVILLEVLCSLTVKKCPFPSINELIKALLGSLSARLSCNSGVANCVVVSNCEYYKNTNKKQKRSFTVRLSFGFNCWCLIRSWPHLLNISEVFNILISCVICNFYQTRFLQCVAVNFTVRHP